MITSIRLTPAARAINAAIAALLVYFTVVQFNDPDPVFWVGLYLLSAAVPTLGLCGYRSRPLLAAVVAYGVVALALTVGGAFAYLPHAGDESLLQDMSPDKPYIEETREFIGTAIALCLVFVTVLVTRAPPDAAAP
jgi:hypothetical protein